MGMRALLAVALLREAAAAPLAPSRAELVPADSYQKYPKSDCPQRDLKPQPKCAGNRNQSVAVLEACCDGVLGCVGFNTHGVIKGPGCANRIVPQPTTDLYLKQPCNNFKSNASCPTPRCGWTAGGKCQRSAPPVPPPPAPPPPMPWPFPNDAQMSTGATTVQLSHDFEISRLNVSPACPTLDTAVKRYQDQSVGLHIARPQVEEEGGPVQVQVRQLLVHVADLDESYPQLNTGNPEHEAYTLSIPADGSPATLSAATIWGGKQAFPVDTPAKLPVRPWITVAIQGQMTNLTGVST